MHSESILDTREGQNEVNVIQGHPENSVIFQKVYFGLPMHSGSILDTREGQNEVNLIQGHQVQFFKKFIFDLSCTHKTS